MFPTQHIGIHWAKARQMKKNLEAAIVIGVPPAISMAAVAKVPFGMDELAVAGALCGEAIETVPCETVDIEVPAWAEIVKAGWLSALVAEKDDGLGLDMFDLALTLEETGKQSVMTPLVEVAAALWAVHQAPASGPPARVRTRGTHVGPATTPPGPP